MPRTNYQKGADKERRILNFYKNRDCIAFRSAGSHSIIDVVAIDVKQKKIFLIQSKLNGEFNLSKNKRKEILDEGSKLNGIYSVFFELWD